MDSLPPEAWTVLGLFVLALVGGAYSLVHNAWRADALSALADELGLGGEAPTFRGEVDGVHVELATEARRSGNSSTDYVVVRTSVPEAGGITLKKRGFLDPAVLRGHTGDDDFDDAVSGVLAPTDLGLLDAETRRDLRCGSLLELEEGRLAVFFRGMPGADEVRRVARVAGHLRTTDRISGLEALATSDPVPDVRARALLALADHWGGAPPISERLRGDTAPVVASTVSMLLGEDPGDLGALEDEGAVVLLERLTGSGTSAQVLAVVERMDGRPVAPQVWFHATAAAAAHPSLEVARAVARVARWLMGGSESSFFADRALVAVAACDDPGVQQDLLDLLDLAGTVEPGLEWLARHGTVTAVPALNALGTEEALQAKAAIQARAGEVGALSVAPVAERGGLSTVRERGGLSAVREKG